MKRQIAVSLVLLLLVAYGCTSATAPPATVPPVATASAVTKLAPEGEWERLIAEAKKEGTVVIAAGFLGPSRPALTDAFKEKYGIDLDILIAAGEQVAVKLDNERKAGIYSVDVAVHGLNTYINFIKPKGTTVPLQPLLVLPEVRDLSKWRNGAFPWGDNEGHVAVILLGAVPLMLANTDMVKPSDITSNLDLLEPKWRGKLSLSDPTAAGTGASWFAFVGKELWGMEKGMSYMKQLAKQEPAVTRDVRLLSEWVARGKYAVALAPSAAQTVEFIRLGAPMRFPELKEPTYTSSSTGNIFVFDKIPHPNAAKLFVNWILSKEGASIFSKAHGYATTRVDVSTDGVQPEMIPRADDLFFGEESEMGKLELMKLAREIFSDLLK